MKPSFDILTLMVDDDLSRVEEALASVVSLVGLPRVHERMMIKAGLQLDPSVYPLLRRVGDFGPLRLSELTRLLGVDMSTASRKVKQLERDGLLTRQSDSSDGRASVLQLSRTGRDILARLRAARHELIEEVFALWPEKDLAVVAPLLQRVAADLAAYAIDPPMNGDRPSGSDHPSKALAAN